MTGSEYSESEVNLWESCLRVKQEMDQLEDEQAAVGGNLLLYYFFFLRILTKYDLIQLPSVVV